MGECATKGINGEIHIVMKYVVFNRFYRKTKLSGFQDMECIPCGDPPPPYEPHCELAFASAMEHSSNLCQMSWVTRTSLESCQGMYEGIFERKEGLTKPWMRTVVQLLEMLNSGTNCTTVTTSTSYSSATTKHTPSSQTCCHWALGETWALSSQWVEKNPHSSFTPHWASRQSFMTK